MIFRETLLEVWRGERPCEGMAITVLPFGGGRRPYYWCPRPLGGEWISPDGKELPHPLHRLANAWLGAARAADLGVWSASSPFDNWSGIVSREKLPGDVFGAGGGEWKPFPGEDE